MLLLGDYLLDPLGRYVDAALLVADNKVVVILASQLDGGVSLANLELFGRLGPTRLQVLHERIQRRRDDEDK